MDVTQSPSASLSSSLPSHSLGLGTKGTMSQAALPLDSTVTCHLRERLRYTFICSARDVASVYVCMSVCVYVCGCVFTHSWSCNVPRSLAGASTLSIKSPAGQNNSRGGRVTEGWGRRGERGSGGVGKPKAERGQWAVAILLLLSPHGVFRTSIVQP